MLFRSPADFYRIMSDVQSDMNAVGEYLIDRWYRNTGSTNAELLDTNYVNYKLNGVILQVIRFKYNATAYESQYYTVIDDRVVLKVPVGALSAYQMEILYLRAPSVIDGAGTTIDMPNELIPIFEMLCRTKIVSELNPELNMNMYTQVLAEMTPKIVQMVPDNSRLYREASSGVRLYNMGMAGGNDIYDITHHYITADNFQSDVNGNYIHRDEV